MLEVEPTRLRRMGRWFISFYYVSPPAKWPKRQRSRRQCHLRSIYYMASPSIYLSNCYRRGYRISFDAVGWAAGSASGL